MEYVYSVRLITGTVANENKFIIHAFKNFIWTFYSANETNSLHKRWAVSIALLKEFWCILFTFLIEELY